MKKVLCFLDNDSGRDVEMLLPLIYFMEKFLYCRVEFNFIWDVYAVFRKKPDLVLLPNTVGSRLYFQISQYAARQNIPVFALISEGNMRTDGSFDYWGYNHDKKFYQEFVCFWSARTRDFLRSELPGINEKLVLTGATGFDRYNIYQFEKRADFLKRKGLQQYKKVIGYAGWAFGKLSNPQGREELLSFFKGDASWLQWTERQMLAVENMLRQAMEQYPEILFVLKRHPNEANPSIVAEGRNEMNPLISYPNVLYVKEEENLHDLISISDIWMGFETTTTMEAWLMKNQMPTLLLNPDPDFNRDQLFKGSVVFQTTEQLINAIEEFYDKGTVAAFDEKEKLRARQQLITDTIGWGDGFNHIRTAYFVEKTLEQLPGGSASKPRFSLKYAWMYVLMELGKYFYIRIVFIRLPKFKKTIWIFEKFRLRNIPVLQARYTQFMEDFYSKHRIADKYRKGSLYAELSIDKNDRPKQ
ncbi:MAG: hypothetical protein JJU28_10645 [Cyclobacteriaceae bacterium]|nr:hypothetical protein [Cyclobacteriaceae bacterium]